MLKLVQLFSKMIQNVTKLDVSIDFAIFVAKRLIIKKQINQNR